MLPLMLMLPYCPGTTEGRWPSLSRLPTLLSSVNWCVSVPSFTIRSWVAFVKHCSSNSPPMSFEGHSEYAPVIVLLPRSFHSPVSASTTHGVIKVSDVVAAHQTTLSNIDKTRKFFIADVSCHLQWGVWIGTATRWLWNRPLGRSRCIMKMKSRKAEGCLKSFGTLSLVHCSRLIYTQRSASQA